MAVAAGALNDRIAFDTRAAMQDEYGGTVGEWVERFIVYARKQYLRGGEQVMASRLDGRQPVVVTVRRSWQTEKITTEWRARDARSGEILDIRSVTPTEDRADLDILCERRGGGTGG